MHQKPLDGTALLAWRRYLQSHAAILRELDTELVSEHGMTTNDYEVLLYLAQSDDQRLAMSDLARRTMLTRSGITRLIDGLVRNDFVERVACPRDARVSYAHLTDAGYEQLRRAGVTHIGSVHRLFVEHFSEDELAVLAELLGRLPGSTAEVTGCCAADDGCAPGSCSVGAAASDEPNGCAVSAAASNEPSGCSVA